jgi:ActR/RegA family two-component response regulator
MGRVVLVVDTDPAVLVPVAEALTGAGYAPVPVATFEDAIARLKDTPVEFLITADRLGAHNGLHLVLRARASGAAGSVVMTEAADPVLDQEATGLGAVTVVAPWRDPAALADALRRARHAHWPEAS